MAILIYIHISFIKILGECGHPDIYIYIIFFKMSGECGHSDIYIYIYNLSRYKVNVAILIYIYVIYQDIR